MTVCSAAALAQATLEQLSATDLFALADQARATGRSEDARVIYDALSRDADAEVRAEARYRKGMMLANDRKYEDAAIEFRALLDEKPDAAGVRLELARMLAAMGDETAARRAIRQAQASGLPDDVAMTVDQFARALRSTKRFGGSVELAFAPDSNINRATQARTLDTVIAPLTLSEDARERSGVGLKLGVQGFARIRFSENLAIVPRIAGSGTFYRAHDFNDVSGSALLGLEQRSGSDRINLSLGQTWRWYGSEPYARTGTASADWLHPTGLNSQMLLHAGASQVNYLRNDLQDGALYDFAIGFERATTQRAGFGLTLTGYRQTARDPGYSTKSAGVSAVAWKDLGKVTMVASVGLYRLVGDERLFLFSDRRKEWLMKASAVGTFRQFTIAGLAPSIRLIIERNQSTVGLYDYNRKAVEFGIARAF